MTTPKAIFRHIARLPGVGPDIVRVLPITSLTTTTVTVDALKRGEAASRYANWYIVRRDAASNADRVRQVPAFNGSTGVLSHAGADYSDTTATDEILELWAVDPEQLDQYLQETLSVCRQLHRDIIPANGEAVYWLDQYSWIEHRGHVARLLYNGSPILGRNPYFHDRNVVSTAGALEPDEWTKTNGTWTWGTTDPFRGPRSLTVTRAGSTVTVEQYLGGGGAYRSILSDAVDDIDGETVGVMLFAKVDTASCVRAFIDDGSGKQYSSYHSGGNTYEELTKEITVSSPSQLSFGFVMDADATATIGACFAYWGTASDAIRRDVYHGHEITFGWRDRPIGIVPSWRLSRGSTYILESFRPFPLLDSTRLLAGNADGDETDIPETLAAYGVAAMLFEAKEGMDGPRARKFRMEFERLRAAHRWDTRPPVLARPAVARIRRV